MTAFIDTNIIVRFIAQDDTKKAKKVLRLLEKVESGEIDLIMTEAVFCEIIYVLHSKKLYNLTRQEIQKFFLPILLLKGIKIPKKQIYIKSLDIFRQSLLDIEDCIVVSHMEANNIQDIYSYDKDFDRFNNLKRKEP